MILVLLHIKCNPELLSAAFKQKRHDGGKTMLAEMQRAVNHILIWLFENISTVEAVTNTLNDRLYTRDVGDSPEGSHTQYQTGWSDSVGRSPFWFSSRRISRLTRKLTSKS